MTLILVADDSFPSRSALVLLLSSRLGCAEIAEVTDWNALLCVAAGCQPELILLDWELPGFCPQNGLAELRAIAPKAAVIALSALPEAGQVSLESGARAFIAKSDPPAQVLQIIAGVLGRPAQSCG